MQETQVQSLGQEGPLEEGMATHSNIVAWRMPRTEEAGGLQSIGSQRVGHKGVNELTYMRSGLCHSDALAWNFPLEMRNLRAPEQVGAPFCWARYRGAVFGEQRCLQDWVPDAEWRWRRWQWPWQQRCHRQGMWVEIPSSRLVLEAVLRLILQSSQQLQKRAATLFYLNQLEWVCCMPGRALTDAQDLSVVSFFKT